ncbi:MAG: HAD family hydrolase [Promethearchaeia archaeon]
MSEYELSITRGTLTKELSIIQRAEQVRAIIFDLHHTITKTRESPSELLRRILSEFGIEPSSISDSDLYEALKYMDRWMVQYQINENVDPYWGGKAKDWLQADRIMLQRLGYEFGKEKILQIEQEWKKETKSTDFEWVIDEAVDTIRELHSRGYILAVATRRHDNPAAKIEHAGIADYISCIEWSGVSGYAKPNPFTLLSVSRQIEVNPRLCAYVGNCVDLDVIAAKRADMVPILTIWENPKEKSKVPEKTIVVDSIGDLTDLFE